MLTQTPFRTRAFTVEPAWVHKKAQATSLGRDVLRIYVTPFSSYFASVLIIYIRREKILSFITRLGAKKADIKLPQPYEKGMEKDVIIPPLARCIRRIKGLAIIGIFDI